MKACQQQGIYKKYCWDLPRRLARKENAFATEDCGNLMEFGHWLLSWYPSILGWTWNLGGWVWCLWQLLFTASSLNVFGHWQAMTHIHWQSSRSCCMGAWRTGCGIHSMSWRLASVFLKGMMEVMWSWSRSQIIVLQDHLTWNGRSYQ